MTKPKLEKELERVNSINSQIYREWLTDITTKHYNAIAYKIFGIIGIIEFAYIFYLINKP